MDRYDPYTDKFLRDTQYDILGTNLAEVGADCISRQALLDAITASINQFGGRYTTDQLNMWGLFSQMITELPPVTPKQRTGKWIYHIDDLFPAESTQECDQCHAEQSLTCDDNFCPNCGAKMEVTT